MAAWPIPALAVPLRIDLSINSMRRDAAAKCSNRTDSSDLNRPTKTSDLR